jgi:hypothetical protein
LSPDPTPKRNTQTPKKSAFIAAKKTSASASVFYKNRPFKKIPLAANENLNRAPK